MPNTPDRVVSQFAALVLTPTIQEPSGKALAEDEYGNIVLVVRPPLSPRKPKSKPGPKRQATADLSREFPPAATHRTREKRALTTAFKLGVLSYATYGRIDGGKGGLPAKGYRGVNLKHTQMAAGGAGITFDEAFEVRDWKEYVGSMWLQSCFLVSAILKMMVWNSVGETRPELRPHVQNNIGVFALVNLI